MARVLESRGFAWVAIEGDYEVAREGRLAGGRVIYGEAGASPVLDQARVERCHALILAIPDALATRQAVAYARSRNPRAEIVARAHSEAEETELRRMGVARIVVAERQVGNELVRHALRFTCPTTRRAYVAPARHFASSRTDAAQPPMGMRVRLKANVDISTYPAEVRVILTALKKYGMFLADNGSGMFISGSPDSRWSDENLATMGRLTNASFEVVQMGPIVTP